MKSINVAASAECISCSNQFTGKVNLYKAESNFPEGGSVFFIERSNAGILELCIYHHSGNRNDLKRATDILEELMKKIPPEKEHFLVSKGLFMSHQIFRSEEFGFFTVSTEMKELYISPSEAIRSLFIGENEHRSRFFRS